MTNSNRRLLSPRITFFALAGLVNIVVPVIDNGRRAVQIAGSLDLTVTVSALYYWLLVRKGLRAPGSLLCISLLGLLRASFAFPGVIPGKEFLMLGAECALLLIVVIGFRRRAGADPVERFSGALAGILPFDAAERVIAGELSVLYYAFAWRPRPCLPIGAQPFTFHKRTGFRDIVLCIGLASVFEIVPVHLLLQRWSVVAAWVFTGLGIYGVIWMVALARSLDLRPGFVQDGEATIRFGLFFNLRIPAGAIRSIGTEPILGTTSISRGGEPNLWIELAEPLTAQRLFGLSKRVTSVAVAADDPAAFTAALSRMAY